MAKLIIFAAACLFSFAPDAAQAQLLTWDFNGNSGSEASVVSSSNAAGLESSTITRGAGLTAANNGGRFNATSWALTSIANAVSGNDYFEFTITPSAGKQFSVSSVVVNWQRSSTGNRGIALRSSVDSYASNLGGEQTIADSTSVQPKTFTFAQTDSAVAVTYRIYGYAESTTGSGGLEGTGNDLVVNGTVSDAGPVATAPTVTSGSAGSITTSGATISGNNVTDDGGATITERGVVWATTADPTTSNNKVTVAGTTGSFNANITGLAAGTTYNVRAYAINSEGTSYGANVSFTTTAPEISIESPEGSAIASGGSRDSFGTVTVGSSADFIFVVRNTGSAALNVSGITFGGTHSGDFSVVGSSTATIATDDSASFTIRFAPATAGARSGTVTFANDDSDEGSYLINLSGSGSAAATAPVVTTSAADPVGATTATLNGNVNSDGGSTVTEYGFVISSTDATPTIGEAGVFVEDVGSGTGLFNAPQINLSADTTYYVQAYAINTVGTSYGGVQSFTTLKAEPTAHVTSFAAGTITTANIPLTWTAASPQPDGYLLLVGTSAPSGPSDGSAVSDDTDVAGGGAVNLAGNATSYSGFTGFAAGTTYTFNIYPYNNSGANIDYRTAVTVPTVTAELLPGAPGTPTFTSVGSTNFTVNWTAATGADSYRLDVAASADFSSLLIGYNNLTVNGLSQTVTGLTAGATYYVRVRAVNTAGNGADSSAGNQTTTCFTEVVTGLVASAITETSFTASWSNFAGATGYQVDVSTNASFSSGGSAGSFVWINEIDYDDAGTDDDEWVELAGTAGTSLDDYELVMINQSGTEYNTFDLAGASFTFADENNGYGFFVIGKVNASYGVSPDYTPADWTQDEIQNGATDSIQLRLKTGSVNVHLIDYEGNNPNTGEDQSTNLADNNSDATTTLFLAGSGTNFNDFTFSDTANSGSPGAINDGQSLISAVAPSFIPGYANRNVAENSVSVTGLSSQVTYYWRVRATNTFCSTDDSVTNSISTRAPAPGLAFSGTPGSLTTTYGTASASTSVSVSGSNLTANINATAPAGFEVSSNNSTWGSSASFTASSGNASGTLYIRIAGNTAAGSPSGNVTLSSTGADDVTVAVSGTVSPKGLTITGLGAENKIYDATTTASVTGTAAYVGLVLSESFSVTDSVVWAFADKLVEADKTLSRSGSYTAPNANYTITAQPTLTASITARGLTVSGASADNKVYDGTTTATISGATLVDVQGSDAVSLTGGGSFANATVGAGKVVTAALSLTGADKDNYTLSQPSGLTASISEKALTISGATATDRTYDGTTSITVSGGSLIGVVVGDSVTLGGSPAGSVANAAVGNGKPVTVSGYTISGADAANYALSQPALTVNITAAALTVTANDVIKEAGEAITGGAGSTAFASSGLVGSETIGSVTISYTDGDVADDPAGVYTNAVVPSNATGGSFTLSNYSVTYVPGNLTVSAAAVPEFITNGVITAMTTTYGTASSPSQINVGGTNMVGGIVVTPPAAYQVSLSSGSGYSTGVVINGSGTITPVPVYIRLAADASVNTYNDFLTLSSSNATPLNMALPQSTVSAKTLTISNPGVVSKVYDDTASATVTGALSGVVNGDNVSFTDSGSTFDSVDAGTNAVTASLSLTGDDAGNYSLTQPTGLTGIITPKTLTVSGAGASNKVYDATTTATITNATLVGVLNGDDVTVSGGGTFASAAVGTDLAVTAALSLSGAQAGNYSLSQPTGLSADITAKPVTVSGITAANKIYDGTTTASLNTGSAALVGNLDGGNLTLNTGAASGAFSDADVGTAKTVTISGLTLGGSASGNYSLTQPTASADITAKALTISANNVSKDFGNVLSSGSGSTAFTSSGLVVGETIGSVTITYGNGAAADDTAGVYADQVTPSDATGGSFTASNYSITYEAGDITVNAVNPTVTTTAASETNSTSAVAGGNVTSEGGGTVANRGVVYATNASPTLADALVTSTNTGTGAFSVTLTNLVSGQTYVYRAFAENSSGIVYGDEFSLTTPCFSGDVQNLVISATNVYEVAAAWDAFGGAGDYVVDVATNIIFSSAAVYATDLIISEYGEGSSNNKWLEIYNGTGAPVDLSNYAIWLIANGGSWPETTISLSGTLNHGETYLIVNPQASTTFTSLADLTSGSLSPNGDDAVGLAKSGILIDAVGEDGPDVGTAWDVAGTALATADQTLIRKSTVLSPTTNWAESAGTTAENSGWIVQAQDYTSDLGTHTMAISEAGHFYVPGYSNRAVSATSLTITGLTENTTYHLRVRARSENCASGFSTTQTVTTLTAFVEIAVSGNDNNIAAGSLTAAASNHTDFGSASLLTAASVNRTFTITNSGTVAMTVDNVTTSGAHAADFTVLSQPASPVAARGSTTFLVRFTPSASGVRSAGLAFTSSDTDEGTFTFAIAGTGTEPEIAVSGNDNNIAAGSLTAALSNHTDFAMTGIAGGTVHRTFVITNSGNENLTLGTVTTSGLHAAEFAVTNQPVSPLAPGETTSFSVVFDPVAVGLRTAVVSLVNNDLSENPFNFLVQGYGAAPEIAVSGNDIDVSSGDDAPSSSDGTDFGEVPLNIPLDQTFVITNTGAAALSLGDVVLTGDASFTVLTGTASPLASSNSQAMVIRFMPASAGIKTATLSFTNNDVTENPFTFSLRGEGVIRSPTNMLFGTNGAFIANGDSTPSLADGTDFGSVTSVAQTAASTFTITNAGNASMTISGIATSGAHAAQFEVTSAPASTVGTNAATTFTITFRPSGAGLREAVFSIASSDIANNPYTFAVQGTAVAPSIAVNGNDNSIAAGSATPDALNHTDFGAADIAGVTVTRTYTMTNNGNAALNIEAPVITGPHATNFIISSSPAASVAVAGSTTFAITFDPSAVGVRSATVSIANNDPLRTPFTFAIQGTGEVNPEMILLGSNGVEIADGTSSAATATGTDFGPVAVTNQTVDRTLFITNSGSGDLSISGVTTSGTHTADFIVRDWPSVVEAGAISNLVLRFDPSAAGVRSATITIISDDADESSYDFVVGGTGQVPPSVTTTLAPATNTTTAVAGGEITADGFAFVTNRGVVWSTSPNPVVPGPQTTNGTGNGTFSSILTNLIPGATYYYRAFAQNSLGTSYGEAYSLTAECLSSGPANLYASLTNGTSFTMVWDAVDGAAGYAVDVSTSATFGVVYPAIDGNESFDNLTAPGNTYGNGSYIGDDGLVWNYENARLVSSTYNMTGNSVGFSTSGTRLVGTTGTGGVASLTYSLRSYFTGGSASDRTLEVYVGGALQESFTLPAMDIVYTRTINNINLGRSVNIEFRSTGTRQIVLDDVQWTGYADIEPVFFPDYSNRAVTANSLTVTGLSEYVTHYYRVRATNENCLSANSITGSVRTFDITDPALAGFDIDGTTFTDADLFNGITITGLVADAGSGVSNSAVTPYYLVRNQAGDLVVSNAFNSAPANGSTGPGSLEGVFSADASNIVLGVYTASVRAVDLAGNDVTANYAFSITDDDTTPPVVGGFGLAGGNTLDLNTGVMVITGLVSDASGVDLNASYFLLRNGDTVVISNRLEGSGGAVSVTNATPGLVCGTTYEITIVAADADDDRSGDALRSTGGVFSVNTTGVGGSGDLPVATNLLVDGTVAGPAATITDAQLAGGAWSLAMRLSHPDGLLLNDATPSFKIINGLGTVIDSTLWANGIVNGPDYDFTNATLAAVDPGLIVTGVHALVWSAENTGDCIAGAIDSALIAGGTNTFRVVDDDEDLPALANLAYGDTVSAERPFQVTTNGVLVRRTGTGTNSVMTITDGALASAGHVQLEFAFGAVDATSGISRPGAPAGGDTTNNVLSISWNKAFTNNILAYSADLSGANRTNALTTNVWAFGNSDFAPATIGALFAAGPTPVTITLVDNDADRTGDRGVVRDVVAGSIRVSDDDRAGPVITSLSTPEVSGGRVILSTSFETNTGWVVSGSGARWTNLVTSGNAAGEWFGTGYVSFNTPFSGKNHAGFTAENGVGQYLEIPGRAGAHKLTLMARLTSSDATRSIAVEYEDSGSWVSLGTNDVISTDYDLLIWDVSAATSNRLRIIREGEDGTPGIFIDDVTVYEDSSWFNTPSVALNWSAATDATGVDEYRLIDPSAGGIAAITTNLGVSISAAATNAIMNFSGMEGVITGYVFAIDADNDRPGDRALGTVKPVILRVDTSPPPAVASFSASNAQNDVNDTSSEAVLGWSVIATSAVEAAGSRLIDRAALSPFVSYRIYYTANDVDGLWPTTTDNYFDVNNGFGSLANYASTNLLLTGLNPGTEYRLAIAGVDEAGNVGPLTNAPAVLRTTMFDISNAYVDDDNQVVIEWTGTPGLSYDVIYADGEGLSSSINSSWQLAGTVQTNRFVDRGDPSGGRVAPAALADGVKRFYRVAPEFAWVPSADREGVASSNVVAVVNVQLQAGNNLIGFPVAPLSNSMASALGLNRLPAGSPNDSSVQNTTIFIYTNSVYGDASPAQFTLVDGGADPDYWRYSSNGVDWVNANHLPLPLSNAISIRVPVATNVLMVGEMRPFSVIDFVKPVTLGRYNMITLEYPFPVKVKEIPGLRQAQAYNNQVRADRIIIINNEVSPPVAKYVLYRRSSDNQFMFIGGGSAENYELMPGEAIVFQTYPTQVSGAERTPFNLDLTPSADVLARYPEPSLRITNTLSARPSVVRPVVSETGEELNVTARVNPHGSPTVFWFNYGLSTAYGQVTTTQSVNGIANSFQTVGVSLAGLEYGQSYFIEFVASNAFGMSRASSVYQFGCPVITLTNATPSSFSNLVLQLGATGGTAPYRYALAENSTTGVTLTINGLLTALTALDTLQIQVTDALGCTEIVTFSAGDEEEGVGDLLAAETFDYSAGQTIENASGGAGWLGGWSSSSGVWTMQLESITGPVNYTSSGGVSVGALKETLNATSSTYRALSGPVSNGVLYAAVLVRPDSLSAFWEYGLQITSGGQPVAFVGKPATGGGVFGIRSADGTMATSSSQTLVNQAANLLVLRCDLDNGSIKGRLYAASETIPAAEPDYTAVLDGVSMGGVDGVKLFFSNSGGPTGLVGFDEIRIATSWENLF